MGEQMEMTKGNGAVSEERSTHLRSLSDTKWRILSRQLRAWVKSLVGRTSARLRVPGRWLSN